MNTATQEAITATTTINFLGLDGNPIEGLKVRLNVDGKFQMHTTDAQGCIPPLQAESGTPVDIDVQRMDGSYKRIDTDHTGSSNSVWTLTSPSLVLEVSTELHQGTPGDAASIIPTWTEDDRGVVESSEPSVRDSYRDEGHNHPVTQQPKPTKPKQAQTKHLPDPTRAVPPKTGAKAPLQVSRDENGNPLVVYVEKVKDWWGRWSFPWLHAAHAEAAGAKTAQVTYVGDMAEKVKALIDTATALTEYEIPVSTATYLAQAKTGKKALSEYKKKESKTSKSWCYKYVKMALVQAHVVDDAPLGESASTAGPELERLGFNDVTANLPDARWAAAGDVIVYRWTDKTWAQRKGSDPAKPNHGHIDIRSYEAYISDYIPSTAKPNWTDYTHIRIYRKVFDPMPTARIRAFLHCLRDYECQAEPDDSKRYNILNTALPSDPNSKRFSGFKLHPWQDVPVPDAIKLGKGSTAAGAYQITRGTWAEILGNGWSTPIAEKDLFNAAMQDRVAVAILEVTNAALSLLRTGKIEDAVRALGGRWASLPGAGQNAHRKTADGKPMDMSYFMGLFDQYLAHELEKEKTK